MSVEINKNDVIFKIPNSEALIDVQRTAIKMRSVGSYYLSGIQDEVQKALNNLEGNFYIDLLESYCECKKFFDELVAQCGGMYRDNLYVLTECLKSIEWIKDNYPHQLFGKVQNPVILSSRKYLKIPGRNDLLQKFKILCLGDVTEIVFQRLSVDTFRIYVKPKKEIKEMIKEPGKLAEYFTSLRKVSE